ALLFVCIQRLGTTTAARGLPKDDDARAESDPQKRPMGLEDYGIIDELTPAALKTVAQGLIAENCRVFREAQRFPNQAAEAYLPIGDKLRDHRGWAHSLETSLNLAKHHDNCARNSPSSPPADGGHPGPCLHH